MRVEWCGAAGGGANVGAAVAGISDAWVEELLDAGGLLGNVSTRRRPPSNVGTRTDDRQAYCVNHIVSMFTYFNDDAWSGPAFGCWMLDDHMIQPGSIVEGEPFG